MRKAYALSARTRLEGKRGRHCPMRGMRARSRSEQHAFPEGLESGAAEHLAFEHLDPAGVSFDYAATPGQGEAGDDDIAVAVNAWDQGMQTGWVVLVDSIEPFGKPLALALSELFYSR
ncbi:hypothetical protein ABZ776_20125 [Streptomyces sp. NPDC007076]|uniref:hypothetical protein n=1 Tax=Streptomyces sp. NPDC007076 TaxID=3160975 RepID=UPI0034032E50